MTAADMNMTKTAWQEVDLISFTSNIVHLIFDINAMKICFDIFIPFKIFLPTEMAPDYSGVCSYCHLFLT